jgi:hypothetical protein
VRVGRGVPHAARHAAPTSAERDGPWDEELLPLRDASQLHHVPPQRVHCRSAAEYAHGPQRASPRAQHTPAPRAPGSSPPPPHQARDRSSRLPSSRDPDIRPARPPCTAHARRQARGSPCATRPGPASSRPLEARQAPQPGRESAGAAVRCGQAARGTRCVTRWSRCGHAVVTRWSRCGHAVGCSATSSACGAGRTGVAPRRTAGASP